MFHDTYNPITHTGFVNVPPEPPLKGVKVVANKPHGHNLVGSGCTPSAVGSDISTLKPSKYAACIAKVDHLAGERCLPLVDCSEYNPSTSSACRVPLRASVDHLSGEACTVREVHAHATAADPIPTVSRGMVTKLVRDRMVRTPLFLSQVNRQSCSYLEHTGPQH
jgi:hypothetical protein